jgi:hypothetical protein
MADCIATREAAGLRSAHHTERGVTFGDEPDPTHFREARGGAVPDYHIHYVWAPKVWARASLSAGSREDWHDTKRSDHVPLVCQLPHPEVNLSAAEGRGMNHDSQTWLPPAGVFVAGKPLTDI